MTNSTTVRTRRSVLYMPGSNARAIEKARSLPVDGIILDLEDAVAPSAKEAARVQVVEAVRSGGFGHREVFVRVNGIDTPWHAEDMAAIAQVAPDAIVVPKISEVEQLERIGQRLLDMKVDLKTRVWAMIETPAAIFNISALAAEAHDSETRLAGFVMGTNDLAKETRARIVPGRQPMLAWLSACVLAAHAHNIDILDGVYNDINDAEGFAAECAQARDLGFDGKTLIHPRQIEACNAAFTPSEAEVAEARAIIAAFEQPENRDKGVLQIEGRMVERMHLIAARRTVAIAEAIAKNQTSP
ncbi:MAG TPA: CoA ester lyase [Xanthobacteraceae bacterium]|nr:CoA ester lyase [Xanthobacteraceae bacterium]